jgi:S1-C subfamily serine protease
MKKLISILALAIIAVAILKTYKLMPSLAPLKFNLPQWQKQLNIPQTQEKQTVVYEESVITKIVEESLPSVVTVGISKTLSLGGYLELDPFDFFGSLKPVPSTKKKVEQNIGSGFIVSNDGLIITNKHVVSDTNASYQVMLNDNRKFDVQKIYRDPLNDLAILKINAANLRPLKLGDSNKLKLGQMAIAIGTPLGEFKNTVTSGIISGLGRGITAGSPFEGYIEKLDNVIQTDAAISSGNSGGPLLNSKGEVIGINTAIAAEGQNIGFAIPVNLVKDLLNTFNQQGGKFERPYLGIRYKAIDQKTAIMNELVEGAYVTEVLDNSPAQKAGIQEEDIITQFDGQKIKGEDDQSLAKMVLKKKVGDQVEIKLWRNKEIKTFKITLEASQ